MKRLDIATTPYFDGFYQNEDGTYSWKFDNYVRVFPPIGVSRTQLWDMVGRITCPTLLIRGLESWASDPIKDGRIKHFQNAKSVNVDKAGHWVHHDQLDVFLQLANDFLDS